MNNRPVNKVSTELTCPYWPTYSTYSMKFVSAVKTVNLIFLLPLIISVLKWNSFYCFCCYYCLVRDPFNCLLIERWENVHAALKLNVSVLGGNPNSRTHMNRRCWQLFNYHYHNHTSRGMPCPVNLRKTKTSQKRKENGKKTATAFAIIQSCKWCVIKCIARIHKEWEKKWLHSFMVFLITCWLLKKSCPNSLIIDRLLKNFKERV